MVVAAPETDAIRLRRRLRNQRRALRDFGARVARLDLELRVSHQKEHEAWRKYQCEAMAFGRFRGNYIKRLFSWNIQLYRNRDSNFVWGWPPFNYSLWLRLSKALSALRAHGSHASGCTKFASDGAFSADRECSCGLAGAFGARCMCRSCRVDREQRHNRRKRAETA